LSKSKDPSPDCLSLLPSLLPVYAEVLRRLADAGADWVQIDEPLLVLDLDSRTRKSYQSAFEEFADAAPDLKLLLTTYFGAVGDNLQTALGLPIAGLHIDLVRAPNQLEQVLANASRHLMLSLGIVDGRNVWRTDLNAVLDRIERVVDQWGPEKVILAPSCSLLHVPLDVEKEIQLDQDLKNRLAFASQKVYELSAIGRALSAGRDSIRDILSESELAITVQRNSSKIHDSAVQQRVAEVTTAMTRRSSGFEDRRQLQRQHLALPFFPTTTIGSFPQTEKVGRSARRTPRL
jgi:5-methyltetrahydropteroyltriglutamate--homocysteine methyltransferase